jgi:hypothetical protein
MTVSGTPRDAYSVKVKITRAGATLAALTAAARISIDGGQTYGPEVPVPSSGALVLDSALAHQARTAAQPPAHLPPSLARTLGELERRCGVAFAGA